MPTAVLDLEFDSLPGEINGLERYHEADSSIRLCGVPVAHVTLPVFEGCLDGVELRTAAVRAGGWQLWERHCRAPINGRPPVESPPPRA